MTTQESTRSENNSNTFLSYYNDIDKFFTKLLDLDRYIPFNEKLAAVISGGFPASAYTKHCEDKLRYFGDLRNQLVHGFRLDHKHYLLVGDHAIEEISRVWEELKNPASLVTVFGDELTSCHIWESLKEVLIRMRYSQKTHLPVYSESGAFVNVLSESTVAYRLTDFLDSEKSLPLHSMLVGDLNLDNTNDMYMFVAENMSVYEVDALFGQDKKRQKRLWAVCVTHSWAQNEQILTLITALDLPKANAYMMNSF